MRLRLVLLGIEICGIGMIGFEQGTCRSTAFDFVVDCLVDRRSL